MKEQRRKGNEKRNKKASSKDGMNRIDIKHSGSLTKEGFNESESLGKEKQAITRSDRKYGIRETDLKLAALEAFNKHKKIIHRKIRTLLKWNEKKE